MGNDGYDSSVEVEHRIDVAGWHARAEALPTLEMFWPNAGVLALVETVKAMHEFSGTLDHAAYCEFRTEAKGWKQGDPPIIECACGLDELEAALDHFDFGDAA